MEREHALLLTAARARGYTVSELGERSALVYDDGRVSFIESGFPLGLLSAQSERIFRDKALTKRVLASIDIPTPKSVCFSDHEAARRSIESLLARTRCVLKPVDGTHGEGVVLDVRTFEDVCAYRRAHAYDTLLLEVQVTGVDLRLHVIGGELVAACVRRPAHVTGDGERTVAALVEARRRVMHTQNPENRLELDEAAERRLHEQALSIESVPEAGRQVTLKDVANVAQGAVPVDVTDTVHADYIEWIARIVRHTGASIFGLDVITQEPTMPASGAVVLEVNHAPNWLHHTFSEGRTHDMAARLLDAMFPAAQGRPR